MSIARDRALKSRDLDLLHQPLLIPLRLASGTGVGAASWRQEGALIKDIAPTSHDVGTAMVGWRPTHLERSVN